MLPLRGHALSARATKLYSTWRPTANAPLRAVHKRNITTQQLDAERQDRERIIVLGSGWAGYTLARDLDPKKYQVVVISPRSYFVFTPLLAGASVGTQEFRTTLEPVRTRRSKNHFFQGWADAVDLEGQSLTIEEAVEDPWQGRSLTFDRHAHESEAQRAHEKQVEAKKGQLFDLKWDKLVIAVGCYNQTFNTKGVRENAFFLKDVGDARRIRNRVLECFETAALPTTSDAMRKHLLNFAVVGGGPTGIEWSAELHDLIQEDMKRIYPDLVQHAQITVYDVAPNVLSMFDERLSQYAMAQFNRQGISIKTSHHIEDLRVGAPEATKQHGDVGDSASCYTIKITEEGEIGIGMCVWSTGLMMNPFVSNALAGKVKRHDKTGGIVTNERLQVKKDDDSALQHVYALEDCAVIEDTSYPATAQVASQKAGWLGTRFNKGDIEQQKFTYKNLGVMAYLGNRNAILQSDGDDISGRVAWFIWRSAYLAKSVSWRNRILIPTYWFVNWLFGRDVSRF
ncbi:pyridine nucleotide-disulfide oxidoreductase-domain-containing protein [Neohortaea acidophila]|uniref:Pyridine nucleotide-disulfide oxidoreductase-domain-containing protein n=1 Tax=Neohortaea acidophila TaxID=245834 RepID=A0A6A6PSM2_9PEZI|nr:pyridine nucleotide-disulfide oxidoreductase-domain-containing protein [Neohortaea acidophila]KAF2482885.1 pyridine nucleotide-disulfide oxidoreductase-domain-containing protein [Neohortaea acidophila]